MSNTAGRRLVLSGFIMAGLLLAAAAPALARMGTVTGIEGYWLNLDDRAAEPPVVSSARLPVSVGMRGQLQRRELDFEDFGTRDVELLHLGAWVGVDLTSWLTVRGQLGASDFDPDLAGVDGLGSDLEWGLGVEARLLQRQVDPMLVNISWIRFDASAHCLGGVVEDSGSTVERLEVVAPPELAGAELPILALGGSIGTPPEGVEGELVVVRSFEELERRAAEAAGRIVLFDRPMDGARLDPFAAYGGAAEQRVHGAARAAACGAIAAVTRSLTTLRNCSSARRSASAPAARPRSRRASRRASTCACGCASTATRCRPARGGT